ncbi:MAG: hypothetical protein LQ337_000792 [Flavoplaca oasis]|nr:MAG: hypothetical protein LQ337_000792 [Flavoplaca oasis]
MDVLGMTTQLLEMNPEYFTIWNYRRLLLRSFFGKTSPSTPGVEADSTKYDVIQRYITEDLGFLLPLLRKFPKCYWIWNYRFWLLAQATRLLPSSIVYQMWQKELSLVGKMLTLDSRNFHGWGYRRQVVSALEELSVAMGSMTNSMTEDEFAYTTKMIEKLELVQRALWADPDSKDQSLWFYHQYLISNFKPSPTGNESVMLDLSNEDKLVYLKTQVEDLLEMLQGAETSKWIYQRLIELSIMSKSLDGRWPVKVADLEAWISKLLELDPLRKGRWQDLRKQMFP